MMAWLKRTGFIFVIITSVYNSHLFAYEISSHEKRVNSLREFKKSNLDFMGYPLSQEQANRFKGKLKSWDSFPVPVYIHGADFVKPILQRYEAFSKQAIFTIKVITNDELMRIKKGIVITQGTANMPRNPEGSDMAPVPVMGTTSGVLGGWGYPNGFPLNEQGAIDGVIYVNLARYEMLRERYGEYVSLLVLHEIGHALGLFAHVDGFDDAASKPVDLEKFAYYTSMLAQPIGSSESWYQQIIEIMNIQYQ